MTAPAHITQSTSDLLREMRKEQTLKPCPFCDERPCLTVRADDAEASTYFAAVACFCGGYSACAHKMATATTADEAEAKARDLWNCRAADTALAALSEPQDERVAFEAWIKSPPFERLPVRWPDTGASAWPGNYRALDIELAWCAWRDGRASLAPAPSRCAECGKRDGDGWALYCVDCMTNVVETLATAPQPAAQNQCDGCMRGLPMVNGLHNGGPGDLIGCTAHLYAPQPSTVQGEVPMPKPLSWSDLSIAEGPAYSLAQLRAYGDARALAAVREPLSEEQILIAFDGALELECDVTDAEVIDFSRAIERAHGIGITAQAQQAPTR